MIISFKETYEIKRRGAMSRNIFIKRIICLLVFMFAVSSIAVISVKAQEVKRIVQETN